MIIGSPARAEDWIESDIKGEHNFALRVKGDSMEPEFNDGDIIIVSPTVHPVAACDDTARQMA